MTRFIVAALIGLLCANGALAQGTGDDLPIGEPVDGPQPGQTYTKAEFDDWQLRCIKQTEGTDPCQLYQLLREANGNPIAELTVFSIPPGQQAVAGANIVTPLETLLQRQVVLAIDGGEPKRYPFAFCNRQGCIARVGLTALDLAALERGTEGVVTIHALARPQEPINIVFSLSGFTAGYDALLEGS